MLAKCGGKQTRTQSRSRRELLWRCKRIDHSQVLRAGPQMQCRIIREVGRIRERRGILDGDVLDAAGGCYCLFVRLRGFVAQGEVRGEAERVGGRIKRGEICGAKVVAS